MGHGHGHGHAQSTSAAAHRWRLVVVLSLTVGVLVVEVVGAALSGSLALLADAGHMATDAAGIALALSRSGWPANRPAAGGPSASSGRDPRRRGQRGRAARRGRLHPVRGRPPDRRPRAEIGVAADAGRRHGRPGRQHCRGWLAAAPGQAESRSTSGVPTSRCSVTRWARSRSSSPRSSSRSPGGRRRTRRLVVIGVLVVPRAWSLLREAVDILLEAAPKGVDLDEVRPHISGGAGRDRRPRPARLDHHLRVPVLSAHVVVSEDRRWPTVTAVRCWTGCECLAGHFDVEHSTLQLEPAGHADHEGARHL